MKHLPVEIFEEVTHGNITVRGKNEGVHIAVKKDTSIYRRFTQILAVDVNKTELNLLIADTVVSI